MKRLEDINEMLEAGVQAVFESDQFRNYLDVMSKFYDYSANNCLLIMMQKPDATLIAGYRKWQNDFQRQVKKGEKAIRIIAPIMHKKAIPDSDEETVYYTFRSVPVFDISQTEGEDLPEYVSDLKGDVDDYDSLIEEIVRLSPVPVSFEDMNGTPHGYFSRLEQRIVVRNGMSQEQTVKTMLHEVAHAILHGKSGSEKDADNRTREVQAEGVAYVVCSRLGIDTSDYSFGYIAGWSGGKEMKALTDSLEVIRRTAKTMIDGLDHKQNFLLP